MSKNKYVHLRMHSEYSVNNSTIRLSDVVRSAAIDQQSALGLTDLGHICLHKVLSASERERN